MIIKVMISEESMLKSGLVLKPYHVNIISERACMRSAPSGGRLHAQELKLGVPSSTSRGRQLVVPAGEFVSAIGGNK